MLATHDWSMGVQTLLMIGPSGTSSAMPRWLVSALAGDRGWTESSNSRPPYDDNREPRGSLLPCARPGPQVPDAMPINIARQVREGKFASQKFASGC